MTAPSVTTSANNARVVGFFGMNKAGTFTPPGGTSERWDQASGSTSSEAADFTQAAAGATGAKTATSNQSNAWVGQLVALNLDATPPSAPALGINESSADSYVSGTTFWYRPTGAGSTFTVNATSSDGQSGLQKLTFPGLSGGFSPSADTDDASAPYSLVYTWPNGGAESGPQTVTATDNAGGTATTDFTVSQDANAPTTTDNTASIGSSWKKTNQTVTLTPSDAGETGVASTYSTTDGSSPTLASPQGTSISLTANGTYTVKYFSTDNVANQEAVQTASTQIRIDKTNPTAATLDPLPGTISKNYVLTGSGTDALSGVASISYYYCPGSPCTPSTLIGSSSTGPSYSVVWASEPPDGTYQVLARVSDAAGNTLDSAKQTVDIANAPISTIDSGPADPTNSTSATFSFSADDPAATFECALDGGGFTACAAPKTYPSLGAGSHTVQVRGTNSHGVGDPVSDTWTVDLSAPNTTVDSNPSNPTASTGATFMFSSTEGGSTFECQLDGGGFTSCSSPKSYAGLAGGSHTFQVRATDAAGNTDASPASYGWTVDLTPPDTSISSGPADPTNSTSATLSFTSTEPGSNFECRIDGGGWSSCTAPKTYSGLAAGSHTVDVRATDSVGNTDASPASSTWTIDLTAPNTTITSTPPNPTNATGASFSFTSTEPGSSFECQLDGGGWSACTSPRSYTSLGQGSHTVQVRATDPAGNTDATPDSFTWTVDTTAPNTTVDSGPSNPTGSTGASFTVSSTEGGSTFECQLDGGGWGPCTSPKSYTGLAAGAHTFQVRATDASGNTDATPASYAWTIDLTPPDTSITATPASPTNATSASFSFSSTKPGSTFECQLDGGGFAACTSPMSYTGLTGGSHTVDIRATDAIGNTDSTPASFTWTVDTTAPDTSVTSGPANPTNSTAASFSFTATEPGSTFECQLDGAGWSACTSPRAYSSLGTGTHTFQVRATDSSGNTDASPSTQTWTIDATPPNTTVDAGPSNPTASTSAPITFSSTESGSSFECQLDGGGFGGCTSPAVYASLAGGNHTFQVRATDAAGNLDASPATYSWTIDATAPTAAVDSGPASPTTATGASFAFSADEPGSTFECKVDGGAFAYCSSPKAYSGLGNGAHTFQVRATDAVGNVGSPASFGWTIDLTPPNTSITAQPSDPTGAADANFSFTSTEPGSSFECQLDGGAYSACTSPRAYSGLSSGTHTFQVRATDGVGNTDASPAVLAWTIDATPPTATIDFGPADPTGLTTADFQFSSSESGSTFRCQLDGAAYAPCTSPATYNGLAEGTHIFRVKAIDGVGNVGAAVVQTWHVDRTPPDALFVSTPTDPTSSTSGTFTFDASEAGSTFQCQLDAGGYSSCASPRNLNGLSEGSHTFQVKATDPLGNGGSAISYAWTVDTTAPVVGLDDPGPTLRGVVGLSATATDANGFRSVRFERSPAGANAWTTIDTDASPPYTASFSTGLAPDGWLDLRAVATDASGNVSTSPVATRRVDNTAPTATLAGSNIYIRKDAILRVTATDEGTGVASVAVQRAPTGTWAWTTLATLTSPPYTVPFDTNGLPDGQYDTRAVVTDGAGNVTTASLTVAVAASGLGVQLTNPGSSISGDVALSATTNGAGAVQVAFDVRRTGTQSWTPLGVDTSAPWSVNLDTALLRDGLYDLRARVTDPDGLTAEDVVSAIRADNTAPSLASSVPAQGARMRIKGTILLTADEALASLASVRLDGSATGAARIKGATASLPVGPLKPGKHTLTGMLVDSTAHTAPFTLRFAVAAPVLTVGVARPTRVGAKVSVAVRLSTPATVTARLLSPAGRTRAVRSVAGHRGTTKITLSLAAPLAPGRYRVSITATTGGVTKRKTVPFQVTATGRTWVIIRG